MRLTQRPISNGERASLAVLYGGTMLFYAWFLIGCAPAQAPLDMPACPAPRRGDPYLLMDRVCDELSMYCHADERVATRGMTCGYITTWSPTVCARDLGLCEFMAYHEFVHGEEGTTDEQRTDCQAAKLAPRHAVVAASCALEPERAQRIIRCAR